MRVSTGTKITGIRKASFTVKIKTMLVSELKPYKLNAKKHPQKQIEGIAESIRRFGFTQPVVIDGKNEIIIGHGRIEAAKLINMDSVPCVVMSDLTANEVKALRLIDNRIAETGWDVELLSQSLHEVSFDFSPFNIDFQCFFDDVISDDDKSNDYDLDEMKKDLVTCPKCGNEFDLKRMD